MRVPQTSLNPGQGKKTPSMKVDEYPPRLPQCGIEILAPQITVKDVQEYTHQSPDQIRRKCRTGEISATKSGGKWLIDRDSALREVARQ